MQLLVAKNIMKKMTKKTPVKTIVIIIIIIFLFLIIQLPTMAVVQQFPNNSCVDCHRKLLFSSSDQRFTEIRIKHIESGISCSIVCHEDKRNKSIASSYALWSISTHALFDVTCEKCHEGNPLVFSKKDSHAGLSNNSIARENTPKTCGKCHKLQFEEFKNSLHFKRLESGGDVPAPACITCHQAHSVHVLTASEIEDFCSNCHNNVTKVDPTVPQRAKNALLSIKELQTNFSKVNEKMIEATASGKNITESETELDSARTIIKNFSTVWHRFNLTSFDKEIQQGNNFTKNAENMLEVNTTNSLPKKSPGFESIITIIGLIIVIFIRRY